MRMGVSTFFFFFNDAPTPEISPFPLPDALPIWGARRGWVRRAAVTLHLTAAAVNQQILNLEAQVGVPLFDRLPRGMQLTTAGELMLAAVRRSQRDFDNEIGRAACRERV